MVVRVVAMTTVDTGRVAKATLSAMARPTRPLKIASIDWLVTSVAWAVAKMPVFRWVLRTVMLLCRSDSRA